MRITTHPLNNIPHQVIQCAPGSTAIAAHAGDNTVDLILIEPELPTGDHHVFLQGLGEEAQGTITLPILGSEPLAFVSF